MAFPQKDRDRSIDSVVHSTVPYPNRHHVPSSDSVYGRTQRLPHDSDRSRTQEFSPYETMLKYARSNIDPDNREVVCGPLLNYRHMEEDRWNGSILIVTKQKGEIPRSSPTLLLRRSIDEVQLLEIRHKCDDGVNGKQRKENGNLSLWKDVLRRHDEAPFHVMIGGGDQIYNDEIYQSGPLLEWTKIEDSRERLRYQCSRELQQACDDWYLANYIRWYNTEPFASALCQIPSLNIWDDHDIIDGFGSYARETMECPVFQTIGALAHKYYMLFQHHLPPTKSNSHIHDHEPYIADPRPEPQYVLGTELGPYIAAHSHSIFTRLGARMAFLGVDARTERTRERTNYPETYDRLLSRVHEGLDAAARSDRPIRHLILLFGIPLAYPPLTWLETAFEGSAGRSFQRLSLKLAIGENAINRFDGAIELLDDLNDHYTSTSHQDERRYLIERFQSICAAHSVRATILSGDVHLAAVGRFFTKHKGHIPEIEADFRFMTNIISSAIVNQPPPEAVAKLISHADKIRELNAETEETLFRIFREDSRDSKREPKGTAVAMPRRNFTIITENSPNNRGRDTHGFKLSLRQFLAKHGHRPLHLAEANAGIRHIAASEQHGKGNDGSLDCLIIMDLQLNEFRTDWNSNDEFFKFTRGRFIVDEAENVRKRQIRFDLNRLASVAADSIGAAQCISIKKYPDGMSNKVFLMTMGDGREVVAKVPNPNAGVPHFTTASEVATMDFARKVLNTPVPCVYAWNSQGKSHPVGAEFIIMDKTKGVPLSHVWDTMKLPQKLQVILAMARLQKQWLSVSFSYYGSLYYARDVQPPADNHYVKDGKAVRDSEFAIGPATGRDWFDAGRSDLDIERGPWASLTQYLQAIGTRERKAIQSLKAPKQIALFCGPKLYRPNTEKKNTALGWYQQVVNALIPKDTAITRPLLWHDDLHDDNVFVDPDNPEKITGIIDWQSSHISPLFNHHPDPAFIGWDGLEPETLDLAPRPKLSGLSPEERSAAIHEYTVQNMFIGWRKLMHAKNPDLYRVVDFRKTAAFGLIFLAHRMFEYGEAHFQSLLVDLKDTWADLPAVPSDVPFPFDFSEADVERIKRDSDAAVAGTELVAAVKETMGDLWPDKGFVKHEQYYACKAALDEVKGQILEQLAETDEERAEYERYWPFE
ncbi:hypothetical protein CNMCM5623_007333 [Aspergillus felis]|uniref:Phosphotransferase enzyme family protein n=1 Tax=Aspergillus felis TaxID=1287682 RepID=A0A8H6PW78_9EURO|nr:hypothetical protein CNMCM5623_007333 [Aspergillus felis]